MSEAVADGWYPDPDDPGASFRYWDGTDWTEHTRPVDPEPEIAAGWYPDPDDGGRSQRYWDGTDWTERTRPAERPRPGPRPIVSPPEPRFSSQGYSPPEIVEENRFGMSADNRTFTYAAIALNAIFLIWAGASTAGFVFLLWGLLDAILALVWVAMRPPNRHCPVCGTNVRKGVTECEGCGYDFHSGAFPYADAQR